MEAVRVGKYLHIVLFFVIPLGRVAKSYILRSY